MFQSSVEQLSKMCSHMLVCDVALPEAFSVFENISVWHSSDINSPWDLAVYLVPNSLYPHINKIYNCNLATIAIGMQSMLNILNKFITFSSNTWFLALHHFK